jgi:SAM-dependent methyltransferase
MAKSLAHEAIYDAVERILDPLPRGDVLDAPAGEGALASRLTQLGFNVHCCDRHPEIFSLPGIGITPCDLNAILPYDDLSFDYVVCIEGLEHIENPHQALREFGRITRDGGQLIVSVPNILNIEERLKWLLYGYTSHFKPLSQPLLQSVSKELRGREEMALHINPIAYSELRYIIEKSGFKILSLYRDRPKKNAWPYLPLVGLIRVLNRCQSRQRRVERWAAELSSDEVLLGGNTLVVQALKG